MRSTYNDNNRRGAMGPHTQWTYREGSAEAEVERECDLIDTLYDLSTARTFRVVA